MSVTERKEFISVGGEREEVGKCLRRGRKQRGNVLACVFIPLGFESCGDLPKMERLFRGYYEESIPSLEVSLSIIVRAIDLTGINIQEPLEGSWPQMISYSLTL